MGRLVVDEFWREAGGELGDAPLEMDGVRLLFVDELEVTGVAA